ncbi:EamA family transporter [Alphaproteobacteria bacterium GH1-50]|uniref:EamA family transporter n=1 Tax=Kangsaoukella pontilimi TaxID=2691042 RepID=A0A7C9NCH7_9RHOB|nr:EamA family transporter [Kangsaoukella pontilimi]MXQ06699.1 EamA family transporter [Kangsaoukella pontilimi]
MSDTTPIRPGALNWALLNLLSLVWGTAFLSIGISLESLPPLTTAAARVSVAALVLVALLPVFGASLRDIPSARALLFAVLAGVIGYSLPFALLAWGQQFVPSAVAGVAMGSVPLLLVPLVFIFSPEEGIGPRRIIGLILGFIGLLLIVGPGALPAGGDGAGWTFGALACVGAAFSYAVASILTRRAPKVPMMVFAAVSMLAGAVVILPIALLTDGVPSDVSTRSLVAAIYLGVFPTAMAGALRVHIIRTAGSLFMSIAAFLVPLWAVIFGVVLMGEDLPPQLFVALALILAGIAVAQSGQIRQIFGRKAV